MASELSLTMLLSCRHLSSTRLLHQRNPGRLTLPPCSLSDHESHELSRRLYLISCLISGSAIHTLVENPSGSWASSLPTDAPPCWTPCEDDVTVIPLEPDDGVLIVKFKINGRPYRGVLDTGSPFLTVSSSDSDNPSCRYWGCWRGEGEPSGLDDTYEMFASQDGDVQWRRGSISLDLTKEKKSLCIDSDQGSVFGVFTSRVVKGGAGDQYLVGLVRNTAAGIRPSFLGQTQFCSFAINFSASQLTLSQKSLIHRDEPNWAPLVDLRGVGAPSQQYCVRLSSVLVNGKKLVSLMPDGSPTPLYGMLDSGSTGLFLSERIFYSLQREAGGWRSVELEFKTASGSTQRLSASTSTSDKFLAFATDFPWLEEEEGHMLVIGTCFLQGMKMTIDSVDSRVLISEV